MLLHFRIIFDLMHAHFFRWRQGCSYAQETLHIDWLIDWYMLWRILPRLSHSNHTALTCYRANWVWKLTWSILNISVILVSFDEALSTTRRMGRCASIVRKYGFWSEDQRTWIAWPLKIIKPICCPETSVTIYQHMPHNIPEKRRH